MLFNSYPFLLGFLPLVLWGYFKLRAYRLEASLVWLTLASLGFYAWWNPTDLILLLVSILFNFLVARSLLQPPSPAWRKKLLIFGVAANLALLGYYKYAVFALGTLGLASAASPDLPLGISFFTFTQIAFLVDASQTRAEARSLTRYTLFVSYFPHLITGPILHHRDIMPQFDRTRTRRQRQQDFAAGLTIFAIGLFKKTVLADGVAPYATTLFDAADSGATLTLLDAWGGVLAYTLQLYFDFSGYSDMAIGLSRLFGIHLPLNFNSPYKSASIIEFWQRWHMTLSRFLRDYLFIPLGGNRKNKARRYLSLMLTMLLGGLWHGAGWNFILWGGLHGIYIILNHAWRVLRNRLALPALLTPLWARTIAILLTFNAFMVSLVLFRSLTLEAAWRIYQDMAGVNGLTLPASWPDKLGGIGVWLSKIGIHFGNTDIFRGTGELFWLAALLCIVWFLPNTQEFMARQSRGSGRTLAWNPGWRWAAVTGGLLAAAILNISQTSEFLYFQF